MLHWVLSAGVAVMVTGLPAAGWAGDVANGRDIYKRCITCHSLDADGSKDLGPGLRGVIGRKAGTSPGYSFSPAMKASGIIWTPENLDKFLSDPRQFVPINSMFFIGLRKPQDRDDVIAYIEEASR